MWLELDDSLINIAQLSVGELHVLQILCSSSFSGQHVLSGSREVLASLQGTDIGAPAQAVLRRALSKRGTMAGLKRGLTCSVRIVKDAPLVRYISEEWQVALSELQESSLSKAVILGEHVCDSELYSLAGEHYRQSSGIKGVRMAAAKGNGGGSAIEAAFRQQLADRYIVVAIVDSDKLHPAAPQSATSKQCQALHTAASWPCHFYEIPCRDLENLIPTNLLEDALDQGEYAVLQPALDQLRSIWNADPEFYKYIDIKEGSKAAHGKAKTKGGALQTFWNEAIESLYPGNHFCEECPEKKISDCKCQLSESLSDRISSLVLQHCSGRSIHQSYKRASTSHNFAAWLETGKVTFDCAIADEPVRV